MSNHQQRSASGPAGSLDWPLYVPGSFIFARDLTTEQRSRLQLLRRQNHFLHDWGIVCGLWVAPANEPGKPWAIQVCPGYAIGCCGEEIQVRASISIDVRDYLWMRAPDSQGPAFVGIRYYELFLSPTPAKTKGCGCEETVYECSRIQDDFQLDILWSLPETADTEEFDLCAQQLSPRRPCSESPYVLLARITLPAGEGDPITRDHIFNGRYRR